MINTILAPTDFSEASLQALRFAAALAERFKAKLHLLHVIDPPVLLQTPHGLLPFGFVKEEITKNVTEQLEGLASELPTSAPTAARLTFGGVNDQINNAATELRSDLIIVATHGHTALKYAFLGSTAERLIRNAPCPVLVFRASETTDATRAVAEFRKIVVPVDFSEPSRAGVTYALPFAQEFDAKVVLFHSVLVHPYFLGDQYTARVAPPLVPIQQEKATSDMEKLRRAVVADGYNAETKITIGSPVQRIDEYVASENVDLIITSTHGHSGLARLFIGSTAEQLVRYARCSVLVVPNRGMAAEKT